MFTWLSLLPLDFLHCGFGHIRGLVVSQIDRDEKCYVAPLKAYYLGDACMLFSELDADNSGALDEEELNGTEYCQVTDDYQVRQRSMSGRATNL